MEGELGALPDGVSVTLRLEEGSASGTGGCNRYFADYVLDGPALSFSAIGSTKMACDEPLGGVESAYRGNLGSVATWSGAGARLELLGDDGSVLLAFDAPAPVSVVGDWFAAAISDIDRSAIVSSLITPEVTASFTAEGELSGSDGCDMYRASFVVDGEAITVGTLATTWMACRDDELASQAQAYKAALEAATTWFVDGAGRLELHGPTGALLVLFEPVAD